MRSTLQAIGLAESAFVTTCSASFKQGTLFEDWLQDGHQYIHPFTPPLKDGVTDMGAAWLGPNSESSFAWSACPSASLAFGDQSAQANYNSSTPLQQIMVITSMQAPSHNC